MKKKRAWPTFLLLVLLALSLQGCLGVGNTTSDQFQSTMTNKNGGQIGINTADQAIFKGKIYFTLDRNLYVLDGQKNLRQLTRNADIRDPAVSPDGKWIAFIVRYKDYSDLAYMPIGGGPWKVLRSGAGRYVPNPPFDTPRSTHHWYAQPAWASDSQHLLFLSDFEKVYPRDIRQNAFLLDLLLFSISIDNPSHAQEVGYATYGDGGLRDPSYRPGHDDQVIYTSYRYDDTQTQQVIQLELEDPNAIARHPYKYRPGDQSIEVDPAVAITPPTPGLANLEAAFSPDGNTLLYVRREDETHMSIYSMPVPENVTGDANNPAFDPNSKANQARGLLTYTKSTRLLTAQSYLSQPIWSPDGTKVAYIGYTNTSFNLWLASVAKDAKTGAYSVKPGSLVQLTSANGHLDADSRPCWTA